MLNLSFSLDLIEKKTKKKEGGVAETNGVAEINRASEQQALHIGHYYMYVQCTCRIPHDPQKKLLLKREGEIEKYHYIRIKGT